ncbi:Deoxyribodipyrimidine photolyase [Prochlorococcus marinus str. MIT 9302]|uniref:Deoxyribodipyrimidine photolyase n=1 Tax=Prochlorococcus marinus str. MIT 9302 TaxID=74545 RepID=A0A0A2A9H3_PROMR|nr:FAD-binding domain-containing protein [Prochlorococcus marinus]KGF97043.1 Deoxyribodipyrimidine photolyase [Prochlorococcus marinus str. MIT 9302]
MSFLLEAQNLWENFAKYKINDYAKLRNFDFGPNNEGSVSKLSPFVTHRILLEYDLINDIKSKYKVNNPSKFIEEIFWRVYWKGWMENRPKVWKNFISEKNLDYDHDLYERAINGHTELDFFNSWVLELKHYNYLHNHTRMWFASTWIFNLGLPWQLGSKFFFKYLFDGDAASNLLSWRWVAGLQTKGKQYLFSPSNLRKFSNNRFNVKKINNKQIFLEESSQIPLQDEIYKNNMDPKSDNLILFENDLHIATLKNLLPSYKKVYIILLKNEHRQIKLSESVLKFKQKLVSEFVEQFDNVVQIDPHSLELTFKIINQIDIIYPGVGENYDFIIEFKNLHNKKIVNLVRDEDLCAWKFATKGFFNFKKNIPKINQMIFENYSKNNF